MVLRNLLIVFLLFFILIDISRGAPKKESFTIRDTAEYIQENSYFYKKDQYKDIFIESINTINSSSDTVLVKIRWSDNPTFEIQGTNFAGELVTAEFDFRAKNIKDVGAILTKLISYLQGFDWEYLNANEDIQYLVANAMLKDVDEYSSVIHPNLFDEFLIESKGSFGGLGIVIGIRDEKLTIISPIEGTPADKAGVKANDRISRIENFETEGFTLEQAIKLLRGEKGSPITIYIERDNVADLIEFKIVRDIIKIKSIESKSVDEKVGYIKINTFQSNTYKQFISALDQLRNDGASSLILDLRGNPGGLFDQALRISNVLLREKLIVSTKSKNKEMNINFFTNPVETPKFDGPLIVLTDRGSASASEIVTGAVKNNQRGIIIGQQTFGKGTVQEVYKQDDGAGIKLTIAEYLSPINYKVHSNGISPNINFIPVNLEENTLITDKEIEKELTLNPDEQKLNIIYSPKKIEENEDDELISFSKFIFNSGLLNKVELRGNTKNFLSILEKHIESEGQKISSSLTEKLENFSLKSFDGGQQNEKGELSMEVKDKIDFTAGTNKVIKGSIVNNSNLEFSNLIIKSESDNKTFNNKYFYIGKIKNNKKSDFKILFKIPSWLKTSEDIVKLSLLQLDMSNALKPTLSKVSRISLKTKVTKKKFLFPKFSYTLIPNESNNDANFDINISITRTPISCNKCFVKILSNDKQLVIKNKRHKVLAEKKENFNLISNLSIPLDKIKNNKIKFAIRFHDEDTHAFFDKNIKIDKTELMSFKTVKNYYSILKSSTSYSEPSQTGIAVGRINKGESVKSIGETENFILASANDEKIFFWLNKQDAKLIVNNNEKKNTYSFKRIYELPPEILIRSTQQAKNDKINIEAEIMDNSIIKNVNYFLNDEKIRFSLEEERVVSEKFNIALKPGRNKLYIVVSDKKDIKTYKEIYFTRNEN
ncbi:PDZ domain-containing protein [bacterium]|nr:PDZ domain-containing protein [bacterium]